MRSSSQELHSGNFTGSRELPTEIRRAREKDVRLKIRQQIPNLTVRLQYQFDQ
jgi:hypothetical protein